MTGLWVSPLGEPLTVRIFSERFVVGGRWLGKDGEGYGVGGGGVVAELEIEAGLGGTGESEGVADEAFGDCGGGGEVGVGGDGVDEVEAGAGDGAGLGGVSGAVELFEGGEADEGDERLPVAGGAVGHDGTQAERAEGGGAEGFERVEGGEKGVGFCRMRLPEATLREV